MISHNQFWREAKLKIVLHHDPALQIILRQRASFLELHIFSYIIFSDITQMYDFNVVTYCGEFAVINNFINV